MRYYSPDMMMKITSTIGKDIIISYVLVHFLCTCTFSCFVVCICTLLPINLYIMSCLLLLSLFFMIILLSLLLLLLLLLLFYDYYYYLSLLIVLGILFCIVCQS